MGYLPDGLHKSNGNDERELDPGVSLVGSDCKFNNTCMSPMYFLNGNYLGGNYSNIGSDPAVLGDSNYGKAESLDNDFGLDGIGRYETSFALPRGVWSEMGKWSLKFKWTELKYTKDLFYFCHIHDNMSGRIKLLTPDGSAYVQEQNDPPLGYEYEKVSTWDKSCGTTDLERYVTQGTCGSTKFLCQHTVTVADTDNEDSSRRLSIDAERKLEEVSKSAKFSECLSAMDCAMHHDMKVYSHPTNPAITFMYQMIPHHINAINMAKSLLSLDYLHCNATAEAARRLTFTKDDKWKYQRNRALGANGAAEDEYAMAGSNCEMVAMLWDIVNGQNAQVHAMKIWLTKNEHVSEGTHCPPEPAVAMTDTPIPFFILLGVLSAGVAMALGACKAYQYGIVKGREYQYQLLAARQNENL